jgi:cellulose synthase/poly-beta-1,6-N-acetylglucosamine synthase-like glycosyltransferase
MYAPAHRQKTPKQVERVTAHDLLNLGQSILLGVVLTAFVGGLVFLAHSTLVISIAAELLFYLLFVGLKFTLWAAASRYRPAASEPVSIDEPDLPMYTVFIPLYKEGGVLRPLVGAIGQLLYPKDRLQVLLLLEEDDMETRAAVLELSGAGELPSNFEIVLAPSVPKGANPQDFPRGKPRALNLGLARATGEFCVIYDAEDRPDPDQLLKAIAAFRAGSDDLACVQARLFFWNEDSSWVSRFYWVEYVTHYEWVLAGLAKLGLIPPLGGTSNHFRTQILRQTAIQQDKLPEGARDESIGGWDPLNVTEDAEVAGALALQGYRVQLIDSVTREEATAKLSVADKQRRRWLKGYLQTGLVYTRHPFRMIRQLGFIKWFCYTLLLIGTPISQLLNPIFWGLTIVYFATRSTAIEQLFPPPLYYSGVLLMVGGNLLLFYQMVVACLRREGYGSVKYMLLTPFWWAFTSYSCVRMVIEIVNPRKRHVWHKTPHGHDMAKEAAVRLDVDPGFTPESAK